MTKDNRYIAIMVALICVALWFIFPPKSQEDLALNRELRHYARGLVITPLNVEQLSDLCDCEITIDYSFGLEGVKRINKVSPDHIKGQLIEMRSKNICGLVNAHMSTYYRSATESYSGIPFTSNNCEILKNLNKLPDALKSAGPTSLSGQ